MGRRKVSFYLYLLGGAAVVGLSAFGFVSLLGRPEIPWDALAQTTGIPADLLPRAIVRADGIEVRSLEYDFKFVTARHRIGEPVEFVFLKNGVEEAVREPLGAYFAAGMFPTVYLLTGLFGFLVGFGVFLLRSEDVRARVFFWLCLAFSSAVVISGDWYGAQGRTLNLAPGVLFFFAYTLTPALLARFALTFTPPGRASRVPALWAASGLFGLFFNVVLTVSLLRPSVEVFRLKRYFFFFRAYFVVLCLVAIVHLFRAHRAAPSREQRDQISWIFYGMVMGLGPFGLLYQIPQAIGLRPVLTEEVGSAFFIVLPLALAIAILKYRFLDISLVVNRSLVYSLLTAITVGVYLLSIKGLERLFAGSGRPGRGWIPLGAAVIAAVAFAPARNRIQYLVDKSFFRRSYDLRLAIREFNASALVVFHPDGVQALLEKILAETLPVSRLGSFVFESSGGAPRLVLRSGVDDGDAAVLLALPPSAAGAAPWARHKSVEAAAGVDFQREAVLGRMGYEAAVPLPFGEGPSVGWLFVGAKKSGLKFTEEDVELLQALAAETASVLGRIRLQQDVAYERASREKSEELSRMKTEFISSVSHELRTPMASLQGLSELLHSGKVREKERRDKLLELMAGECGRLARFLTNVLDFGRIEQDAKHYDFQEADLRALAAEVVELARTAAAGEDLELRAELAEGPVTVEADPDAVRQALLNLVDNAIKYSQGPKRIGVRLTAGPDGAELSVSDNGIGISTEDRERIFEAFFRSPAAVRQDPKGVGLGLKIVKHIMDAHGGTVNLESEPGRGATFTLKFPKRRRA